MITLFILLILATFLGMCVYALFRARKTQADAMQFQTLLGEVRLTRIADTPADGRVHLSGRVTGKGGATVSAPFTGDDAVWARATLQSNIGQVAKEWIESVATIVVDDGSGKVVHLQPLEAKVRLPEVCVSGAGHADRIAAYLAAQEWKPGPDTTYFEYESALRPGDTISVLGTVRGRGAAYRESAATLELSAEDGELVIFDADEEKKLPEASRRNAGCAMYGIAFFAIAMIVTAILGYAR
ncbi:MAG: hypothetical protein HY898_30035 [Deltaproteobacteria bacterium]|nr:hypothetical protein [Deltaproteobacteria bacterium]